MPDLDQELDKLAVKVDRLAKKAYRRLLAMIEAGKSPQEALQAIYLSFSVGSFNHDYLNAVAAAFTTLLEKPFKATDMMNYTVGGIKLSTKLYQNATELAREIQQVLDNHAKTFLDLRKVSLELYSGYGQKSTEVLKIKNVLPKYLKKTYAEFSSDYDRQVARMLASGLKTDALRASYLTFIDKLENGAGKKALSKALESAGYEKARYLAARISQTELARAYNIAQAKKIAARDDIDWVQLRPSHNHEQDFCDLYLKPDRYGKGAGVFPRDEAPVPIFHPHCRCRLVSLVNVGADSNARVNPNAQRDYMRSLSEEDAKKVLPKGGRDYIENNGDITDYLNQRNSAEYAIKRIKDIVV